MHAMVSVMFVMLSLLLVSIDAFRVSPARLMVNMKSPLSVSKGESDADGYDAFGTLTRQGLLPYVIRLVQPDTYNAAVEKYIKLEKVKSSFFSSSLCDASLVD